MTAFILQVLRQDQPDECVGLQNGFFHAHEVVRSAGLLWGSTHTTLPLCHEEKRALEIAVALRSAKLTSST